VKTLQGHSASTWRFNLQYAYHFRAIADGGIHGVAYGDDITFTTLSGPEVRTNAATKVSYTVLP